MRAAIAVLPLLALCACSTLPEDGPSTRSAPHDAARAHAPYALVDLDYGVTQQIANHPPTALAALAIASSDAPNDLIGEGDALAVSVVEAGSGGLFGRPADVGGDSQQGLPRLVVDRSGAVFVPFAGAVHVAGLTPREAGQAIENALKGRAVDPQVNVTLTDSRANSVVVIGAVRNAGHVPIAPHGDRLLDVLATAGGPSRQAADLAVVVERGGRQAEIPFSALLSDPSQNIRLAPQDQIRVIERVRKYSLFGAFVHASQTSIDDERLTLAEAIGRAGGLDVTSANASSVMVFRFERPEVADALGIRLPATAKGVPMVYRLNYRKPEGVFVADNFEIRAEDLLYVPRSDSSEALKFLSLINTVTQIGYNIRVANVIP